MREINNIVIHCTATPQDVQISGILNYWRHSLGWANPGYHYIIDPDGVLHHIHPLSKIANGVKGHNSDSIHISYIGGVDQDYNPLDNRTEGQLITMESLVRTMAEIYPDADIKGHRDFENVTKACPSFDVAGWISNLN